MQTIANKIAAVKTSAARTGETGTFITFDTPEMVKKEKDASLEPKNFHRFFFFFD
jgi:hypothetical protein